MRKYVGIIILLVFYILVVNIIMSGDDENENGNGNNGNTPPVVPPVIPPVVPPVIPPVVPPVTTETDNTIVDLTLDQTITTEDIKVVNQQGTTTEGNEVTHTTFDTIDPKEDVQITENLTGVVKEYNDELNNSASNQVLTDIRLYAGKITCSDFHGKGTIDDYSELFRAASKIANDTKQIQLDIDVEGFDEFGKAADDLSKLFTSFIVKLENVNIINDINFLTTISIALKKIWNLSEVFGRFKQTILATSTVQMPKSAHDARLILEGVMDEVNCAMGYISHFVNPVGPAPVGASLSVDELNIITTAVSTIDNWNILCDQGVRIAMTNNPDVQYITQANASILSKTNILRNAAAQLTAKMALYMV